ncbi:hypothetical protein BT93_L3407 [Corymbia citriodora subsp. variegata]|uniref:Endonuclease/exonuclease/phosphatase domain-containing protein n=1 Tax=Corymbia citriodora subsp. variegata TaxID=360336 RepID=A0A8T0CJS8_CORYI|nr:hypothetical protein BT93_L3407 [Corymbia citriodora subsp. variegata]
MPDQAFRRRVLESGPLTVAHVQHASVPVWVRLKNIPYALWSAPGINVIASVLGKPLYVDQRTEQMKLLSFARVCIEMSATSEFPPSVDMLIGGTIHKVEVDYEWRPVCCQSCGLFGYKCLPKATREKNNSVALQPPAEVEPTLESRHLVVDISGPIHSQRELGKSVIDGAETSGSKEGGLVEVVQDQNVKTVWQTQRSKRKDRRKSSAPMSNPMTSTISMRGNPPRATRMEDTSSSLPSTSSFDGHEDGVEMDSSSADDLLDYGDDRPKFVDPPAVEKVHKKVDQTSRAVPRPTLSTMTARVAKPTKSCQHRGWRKGLVDPVRQAEARMLVRTHNLCCIGILETKVPTSRFDTISSSTIPGWRWTSNYAYSPRGRIWVGWDPSRVNFNADPAHSQVIHGTLSYLNSDISFYLSVIYREHTFVARRILWADLVQLSSSLDNRPWLVAGDFNAIHDPSDRVGSIDRVLVNSTWCQDFSFSEAAFVAPGISDHTPMIVKITNLVHRRKPFKFFNFWMDHPQFRPILCQAWDVSVTGNPMYRLYSRLKEVKACIKQLNKVAFSNISSLAAVIPSLVGLFQSAFVKGRRISDNILLAQELFSGFHVEPYLPKCAVKVDFQKAYDTLDWDFLELTLKAFGFPLWLIERIMICVRTPRFSIAINGELHGWEETKARGPHVSISFHSGY